MIIESHIETAAITLLSALTYIDANKIPVREFRDNSEERAAEYVVVHVLPAGRIEPNYDMWRCQIELICVSYAPDDRDRASLEALYQACLGWLNTVTAAQWTAALPTETKVAVDGVVPDQNGGDEDVQDNFQMIMAKATIFSTYTP